ncbi:phage terminase, ATPase subunit P domain protein [Escherichia coli LT-68]|nr:phage terminase, ATPase subunit P domain protein [Escherichia coli LT-68]
MILKSRQIGATWYFAQEALLMALRDDVAQPYQRNQIFLLRRVVRRSSLKALFRRPRLKSMWS